MSETKDVVTEAADGVKTILGRLGEFFHIFDLSFIVSGAVSFGALVFLAQRIGVHENFPFAPWVAGFAVVISCYVCGLVCFSLGRLVNGQLFRRRVLSTRLRRSIEIHQLKGVDTAKYYADGDKELWRLYVRLWQVLAARHARTPAFSHLSRYWAMAATFDGVAVALLMWACVLPLAGFSGTPGPSPVVPRALALVFLVGAILSLRQGAKYYEFQIEDLVAALAAVPKDVSLPAPGGGQPSV